MIIKPGDGHVFNNEQWGKTLARSADENFFNGSFTGQSLTADPLVTGYAFIKWIKLPSWVEREYPNARALLEKNFKSFSGLSNIALQLGETQSGFSSNTADHVTGVDAKPKMFNMLSTEFSGSPMRNLYTHWATGIRDPETGIARYPKEYGINYSTSNHTGEFVYIMTRPDADNASADIIEFAAYFTHAMPTVVNLDGLNFTSGSHDAVEIDQPFAARMHMGAKVDAFAKSKLQEVYKFKTMGEFDPTATPLR